MPKIREYVSQRDINPLPGGRQADGADFGGTGLSDLGTGIQSAGHSAGIANRILLQNQMRQEVTKVDTQSIQANADLTLELQRIVTNWEPGDGDITETFHNTVKDRLTTLGQDAEGNSVFETGAGQRHYEQKAAALASQFAIETSKAQAHLDGLQAVHEHGQMVDTGANLLQQHPAYFDSTRDDLEKTINNPDGIYARIPGVDRAKLLRKGEEMLAIAAVYGQIRQTPLLAQEKLSQGWMSTYVPAEKYPVLKSHADTAVHALGVEARQAATEERQRKVDLSHAMDANLVMQRAAHDVDPKQPDVTPTHILDAVENGMAPEVGRTWLNMLDMEARQGGRKTVKSDPGVARELFRRVHAPYGAKDKITDTDPIYRAYLKEQLNREDRDDLVKQLTDSRTPEGEKIGHTKEQFLSSRKTSITHSNLMLGKLDQDGDTKYGDYAYMVDRKIEQYRKGGKDPHELFNPKSPDFVGSPEAMKPYLKSMQDTIKTITKKIQQDSTSKPDVLPEEQMRKPGESYGDWKARQK